MTVLILLGTIAALCSLPGTLELFALSLASLFPSRRRAMPTHRTLRIAAVLPAHNEELNIARCVRSLLASDREGIDLTISVVADNCTDATAEAALAAGARVLVRQNALERGKGYALDFAFRSLLPEGHDVFIVVDADSEVTGGFVQALADAFRGGAQAAQGSYTVRNTGDSVRTRLMSVALLAFNVLRPRGRDRLGLSAGIYGNGFALTAETLRKVPYTASSVVEDLEYHLALVRAGVPVRFVQSASVQGDMPVGEAGAGTQRARWEGGRFRMMTAHAPRLLVEVLQGRGRFLEPLLDLILLPLGFHALLLISAAATPYWLARDLGLAGLAVLLFHLLAAIAVGGGTVKDVAVLVFAPFYIGWKLLLIPRLLRNAQSGAEWVRTEREPEKRLP